MQLIKTVPIVVALLLTGCAGPAYTGQGANNAPTASETPEQRAHEKAITEDAANSPVFDSRQAPERRSPSLYDGARRVQVYPTVGYGTHHGWGGGVGLGLGSFGVGL
ncbi:hypothetical protein [Carnimonas bestiolae]|uniref:hypothetical protein n=1 Tax=Carnimonas bestiolae TaxID=3402172 RepID=UPI003EDC2179